MKVGFIGAGGIAWVHGRVIAKLPGARLVGVADLDLARAKDLAGNFGNVPAYDDPAAMLDAEKPDVVHVLVPPAHHAEVASLAFSRGCHVLVEKPMALTTEDARRMIDEARQAGVRLCANHNMLFDPVVQRARAEVAKGAIGHVRSVETSFVYDARRNPVWLDDNAELSYWVYKLNGGPLQDLMPHAASLVLEYFGELRDLSSVSTSRGILAPGYPDEIRVALDGGEILGSIQISVAESPDMATLTIRGSEGLILANTFNGILQIQKSNSLPRAANRALSSVKASWQNLSGTVGNVLKVATGRFDQSGGMRDMIGGFYASIASGARQPHSAEQGLAVVQLTERVWPEPVVTPPAIRATVHTGTIATEVDALVTGASGFVGTHLVQRLLEQGKRVRTFIRPGSVHGGRLKTLDVEIVEADLSDRAALREAAKGARVIVHAGAAMSGSWEAHEQTTIGATEELIEAALEYGTERLVFLSSLAVFETTSVKTPTITEDSPYARDPKEMGGYAWSKIEAEKRLFQAHEERGLPMAMLRPGIVLGPRGPVFFPHLGFRYRDAMVMVFGLGGNPLPITVVDNTVDAICLAAEKEAAVGQVFNIVDDDRVTVRRYLDRFGEVTGVRPLIVPLPRLVPYGAALAYEMISGIGLIKKGVTSRRQLRAKHHSRPFPNDRAKAGLGWSPRVPLETGMDRTFTWYRDKFVGK